MTDRSMEEVVELPFLRGTFPEDEPFFDILLLNDDDRSMNGRDDSHGADVENASACERDCASKSNRYAEALVPRVRKDEMIRQASLPEEFTLWQLLERIPSVNLRQILLAVWLAMNDSIRPKLSELEKSYSVYLRAKHIAWRRIYSIASIQKFESLKRPSRPARSTKC